MNQEELFFESIIELSESEDNWKEKLSLLPAYFIACKRQTLTEEDLRGILQILHIPIEDPEIFGAVKRFFSILQGAKILNISALLQDTLIDEYSNDFLEGLTSEDLKTFKQKIEKEAALLHKKYS